MSAGEPDWLTAMRDELDRTPAGGWWPTTGTAIIQLRDNARRLLAEHDRTRDAAEQMAAALGRFTAGPEYHHQRSDSGRVCMWCGLTWPCPEGQAADALRAWQEREAD